MPGINWRVQISQFTLLSSYTKIDEISDCQKKIFNFEKVDIDLDMMIETHKKLINGSHVESKTMNTLLLGGVVNILHQTEAFEAVEARAKALEQDNVTNKARIEALETWVLKQNHKITELDDKLLHQEAKKSEN